MSKATSECEECGGPLSQEEIELPIDRGYGNICDECDCRNHHWVCGWCECCEDEDYEVILFAVRNGEDAGIEEGIYLILDRPFYRQPLIGGGAHIYPDCVLRIADLPRDRREPDAYPPCALLCGECAAHYVTVEERP